jgi:hypothetical protein
MEDFVLNAGMLKNLIKTNSLLLSSQYIRFVGLKQLLMSVY